MCSNTIFRYKCGCNERVVFECPFSSTTNSDSGGNADLHSHRNCSRRYRRHQQKLLLPKRPMRATATPSSHQASSRPSHKTFPIIPCSPGIPRCETRDIKELKLIETPTTVLDEICHDCWQRTLRLTQMDDDDTASSATTKNSEERTEYPANARILTERSVNELVLLPLVTDSEVVDLGAMSSVGGTSAGDVYGDYD
ncbi:hypothetical protein SAMD00023353_2601410 [Rosellinia necatrix]|uniref:Uncharacterized protein n=1 Tax=Rosellinia necatrix TaxID=77044 RepID=A0A1S8A850_ROSNE|nr:hypothetical protein SAMD00023353_2601410 [Rosellinia necatrix]